MAMEHDPGTVLAEQRLEAFKAPVRQIRLISQPGHGRVRQQKIKAPGMLQLPLKTFDPGSHFGLCEHTGHLGAVSHGTAKPQNPDPVDQYHVAFRVDAPFRGLGLIIEIMVSVNINHGG